MTTDIHNYTLFIKFLKTFTPIGFVEINPENHLMLELEKLMEKNNQFLYVADIIQMKVLFTSKLSTKLIGVEPKDVSPHVFMEATHPDDVQRLCLGRTKLIEISQKMFVAKKGTSMISTNFKIRNGEGGYSQFLIQGYLFYTTSPYETVFFLKIHTNIDWCKKMKHGYHYYLGNDMSHFRYPDMELLNKGNILTKREFEILKMIASGLTTEQVAEKLFLSHYTINTHRGNILKKTGKGNISELIFDFHERGLL